MDSNVIVALISAGTTIFTLVGGFWAKFYWERRKEKKYRTFSKTIPNMHKVYQHLNQMIVQCGSSRAMVMYTENGGGRPTIGAQLYVSIVYEVYHFAASIRDFFQRVRIDESYIHMLGYMMSNPDKRAIIVTEQLPDCMLKNIYRHAGTQLSIVYLIKETDKRLYYASFNFPHNNLTAELLMYSDLEANAIKNLFRDVS